MSRHIQWPKFSYNYFSYNADFLLLGASKQKRAPWVGFYGHMYAYLRGEYTYFYNKALWLNYLKKMRLIDRLKYNHKNNFFLITNRLEHVRLLNDYAPKIGADTLFFERTAQFSIKCGRSDMTDIVDNKMRGLGAFSNKLNSKLYWKARSKIFIILANNSYKDKIFLQNLASPERSFLTFSPADTNSLFIENFLPLFGNNSSARAWHFYLSLFAKRPFRGRLSSGHFKVKTLPDSRFYKWNQSPHNLQSLAARAPRSFRAFSRLHKKPVYTPNFSTDDNLFKFDSEGGRFRYYGNLPFARPAPLSKIY